MQIKRTGLYRRLPMAIDGPYVMAFKKILKLKSGCGGVRSAVNRWVLLELLDRQRTGNWPVSHKQLGIEIGGVSHSMAKRAVELLCRIKWAEVTRRTPVGCFYRVHEDRIKAAIAKLGVMGQIGPIDPRLSETHQSGRTDSSNGCNRPTYQNTKTEKETVGPRMVSSVLPNASTLGLPLATEPAKRGSEGRRGVDRRETRGRDERPRVDDRRPWEISPEAYIQHIRGHFGDQVLDPKNEASLVRTVRGHFPDYRPDYLLPTETPVKTTPNKGGAIRQTADRSTSEPDKRASDGRREIEKKETRGRDEKETVSRRKTKAELYGWRTVETLYYRYSQPAQDGEEGWTNELHFQCVDADTIADWKKLGITYETFTRTEVMNREAKIVDPYLLKAEIEAGRYRMGDKYE